MENTIMPYLLNLALVTLADSISSNALKYTRGPSSIPKRGYWNLGTISIILCGVADLSGAMFTKYLVGSKRYRIAILINNLSVCFAAMFTLITLQFLNHSSFIVLIVAPLFKLVGGGSHVTAFLMLVHLHEQEDPEITQTISYYITGGVVAISHLIGSFMLPLLANKSDHLPYALSVLCCGVSLCILVRIVSPSGFSQSNERPDITEYDALLGPRETISSSDDNTFGICHGQNSSQTLVNQKYLIAIALCLGGVPKAMRPLFSAYIQHRADLNPPQAYQLCLLQGSLSVIILILGFPCVLCLLQSGASVRPSQTTLYGAKLGFFLMGIGALMIGLAGSASLLVPALIIDSLGVATELSLLAYLASLIKRTATGRMFMLIASLESSGYLVGIAILYPVYQWSVSQTSLSGGSPYYICAAIYLALSWLIWGLDIITE